MKEQFGISPKIHLVPAPSVPAEDEESESKEDSASFKSVCLGGTFDRLHLGHKVLLSAAVARATEKLVVGVTDGDMIKSEGCSYAGIPESQSFLNEANDCHRVSSS